MTQPSGRSAVAVATALVLVLSLATVPDAAAVATATGAGIRITDPNGGPVAQATVSLTFNGETKTAKTDDDGMIAIVFGGSGTSAPKESIVLTGDGSGTIKYPGGPAEGEAFTVRGGVITMTSPAAAAITTAKRGVKKSHVIVGAGVVAVGAAVALSAGGNSTATPATPPPINVSRFFGTFRATLTVVNPSGCGRRETVQVTVILSGNPDGSGFILNKGGLIFRGVMQPDGSFEVVFSGPINGFAGLPNGTGVTWQYRGTGMGDLSADGQAIVTGPPCPGGVFQTSLAGPRN